MRTVVLKKMPCLFRVRLCNFLLGYAWLTHISESDQTHTSEICDTKAYRYGYAKFKNTKQYNIYTILNMERFIRCRSHLACDFFLSLVIVPWIALVPAILVDVFLPFRALAAARERC